MDMAIETGIVMLTFFTRRAKMRVKISDESAGRVRRYMEKKGISHTDDAVDAIISEWNTEPHPDSYWSTELCEREPDNV